MKIYTKKGDKDTTWSFLGTLYSKADRMKKLHGGMDEINAHVGLLRSKLIRRY